MARVGANAEQLDVLARAFEEAGALLGQGGASVRQLMDQTWWRGADADRFRSQAQDGQRTLGRVAERLGELASTLKHEAEQQRQASGATAGATGGRASPASWAGGSMFGHLTASGRTLQHPLGLDLLRQSMLRTMGFISRHEGVFLDPQAARAWLSSGPPSGLLAGEVLNAGLDRPSSALRASAFLGGSASADAWSGWQGHRFTGGFNAGFQAGIGGEVSAAGGVGFASYDARLRALIGAEGSVDGSFSLGPDGLSAAASAEVFVGALAEGSASARAGGFGAAISGEAAAGAAAAGAGSIGVDGDGIAASGGVSAFAGASAEYSGSASAYGAGVTYGGGVRAGVGFDVDGDLNVGWDELGFDLDVGAALGIGADLNLGVNVSPKEIFEDLEDLGGGVVSTVGDAYSTAEDFVGGLEDVGSAAVNTVKKLKFW